MGHAIRDNFGKVIAAGGALVGGIMLKGLAELNQSAADFRAETGATADEADRAKKAILEMSGKNIQPLGEIGQALTKVHTEMGLAGDEAEKVTQRFLTFARATKNNAAAEVSAFDNILDAWNLTAKDSQPIMDALIVSHQRYGGSISADEKALADLAPALLAANQKWQDGIALLNLFHQSGLDNEVAISAMTKALGKVHSTAELKALIADIIATEDPLERAAKASDLFGAKAGAKLANALKPGIDGLDEYGISASDAAGATQKAADVLDSEFGAQFQLLIKKAGAAIIGFGNDWGGLATVIATTLTVAGGLGGGKLVGALAGVWTKAASSGVVTKAVAFAAGKAATVYLAALIAGDAIGAAVSKAWAATGARVVAAAGLQGAASGTAFAVAATAAIVAAPLAILYVAIQVADDVAKAKATLASQIDRVIQEGTMQGLLNAKAALQAQIESEKILGIIPFQFAGEVDAMNAQIARIDAAIATLPPPMAAAGAAATHLEQTTGSSFTGFGNHAKMAADAIKINADAIAARISALTATLLGQATALINGYYDPIIAQDELRVAKDTVAADKIAVNATKAGTAERHQADLTLANSQKNLDLTRANLLASGQLTKKDQHLWLADLEARYKTATGAAKKDIGDLIAKLKELKNVPTTIVKIIAEIESKSSRTSNQPRAGGGSVIAGHSYLVNENTPNSEIWVPSVSGQVIPSSSMPVPTSRGGDTYNVNVAGLMPARTVGEVGNALRRLSDFGVLPPRRPDDG